MKILSTFFAFMLLASLSFGQYIDGDLHITNMSANIQETGGGYANVSVSFTVSFEDAKMGNPKGIKGYKDTPHNIEIRVGGVLFYSTYRIGETSVSHNFTVPTDLFETTLENGYHGFVECGSLQGGEVEFSYDGCIVIVEPCNGC